MALKQLGVGNVVAKAGTPLHGAILERVGADRVVFPEREMGVRIAHLFAYPNVIDYVDVAPGLRPRRGPRPGRLRRATPLASSTSAAASSSPRSPCAAATA